jgi:hypothetical protein
MPAGVCGAKMFPTGIPDAATGVAATWASANADANSATTPPITTLLSFIEILRF